MFRKMEYELKGVECFAEASQCFAEASHRGFCKAFNTLEFIFHLLEQYLEISLVERTYKYVIHIIAIPVVFFDLR